MSSAPHATKHVKTRLQLHVWHPGPHEELLSEEHPLPSVLYKRELSGTSPRNHVSIASKAPAGDGDEGCLRNVAQLSPVSCQLRTSTGPLTTMSLQATKKADPRACVTHSRSSWRSTAYGFGYSESQLLQDALNRGLHFWKNRNKFGMML